MCILHGPEATPMLFFKSSGSFLLPLVFSSMEYIMVNNMRHIYIHDTNTPDCGIGYIIIKIAICSLFSKDMVG